ncbi:MAG: A/G-specific adenine glycosylase [Parcubacteria group bacterium]|nr:A/G-specific adenine glycosylase [Parcubacteria group bacterium]
MDKENISKFRVAVRREGLSSKTINVFRKIIYDYYRANGRKLLWRETISINPYYILVSEVMLQQTQVDRVKEKYMEFIKAFPTIRFLARAPLRKILRVWQGLGYNRRALSLKNLAMIVCKKYDGTLPKSVEALDALPGIGYATASSICAFAFNAPTVFIETNIRSVFIFFFFWNKKNVFDKQIASLVEKTLDSKNPRVWYWALMDYGAMLKKEYPNPSRASARHHQQSPFANSHRQLRGQILKFALARQTINEKDIKRKTKRTQNEIIKAFYELEKEKLLKRIGKGYSIE